MSSAQTLIKTDASCLHVSSCFYRRLYRANALKRDEAKRNRAWHCGVQCTAMGNRHLAKLPILGAVLAALKSSTYEDLGVKALLNSLVAVST